MICYIIVYPIILSCNLVSEDQRRTDVQLDLRDGPERNGAAGKRIILIIIFDYCILIVF